GELLRLAGEWNRRAERSHPDPDVCRAIWSQRADLARRAGDPAAAAGFAARAAAAPRTSPREAMTEARQVMAQTHHHAARAVARERGKRYALALDDLARALELGFTPTQVYLVRVRVYEGMGDKGRAAEELSRAMKTEPADERGWLARALARATADDLPGAL